MSERPRVGVLDTSAYIDLGRLDPELLPEFPELTAITLAELHQGVMLAKEAASRAARSEALNAAVADFAPVPFDGDAAARYGSLVGLIVASGRNPRPRRIDLMIAAIASCRALPLYTRNGDDFAGLEQLVTVVAV